MTLPQSIGRATSSLMLDKKELKHNLVPPLLMPSDTPRGFDFSLIDNNSVRDQVAQETVIIRATTSHAFMIVGRSIHRIKNLLEGTGLFPHFVEAEFGFTSKTANRYINGYLMLSAYEITPAHLDSARLGKNTIHMLTSQKAPREVVSRIMEKIRSGEHVSSAEVSAALASAEDRHLEERACLEDEVQELKRQVEQQQSHATRAELDSLRRREQLDRASQQLEAAHTEINDLERQIDEMKNALDALSRRTDREMADETHQVEGIPGNCRILDQALSALQSRKSAAEKEITRMEAEVLSRKAELEQCAQPIQENVVTCSKLVSLESRIKDLMAECTPGIISSYKKNEVNRKRLTVAAAALRKLAEQLSTEGGRHDDAN